jgi:hypothetical protein
MGLKAIAFCCIVEYCPPHIDCFGVFMLGFPNPRIRHKSFQYIYFIWCLPGREAPKSGFQQQLFGGVHVFMQIPDSYNL